MNSTTECRAVILHNEKEEESMNSLTECRAVTLYNAHNNNNNNSNNNKRKGLNSTTECKAVTLYNFDGKAPIYLSDDHHLKSLHSFPIAVFFCKYPSVQNITFSQFKKKKKTKIQKVVSTLSLTRLQRPGANSLFLSIKLCLSIISNIPWKLFFFFAYHFFSSIALRYMGAHKHV